MTQCLVTLPGHGMIYNCILEKGHVGPHVTNDGRQFGGRGRPVKDKHLCRTCRGTGLIQKGKYQEGCVDCRGKGRT